VVHTVELKPKAIRDLRRIDKAQAIRIADSVERLQHDLQGDVKKLTNHTPEHRLRVGDYRVLLSRRTLDETETGAFSQITKEGRVEFT
jgi:mRNA interferase RelE/StbE